MLIAISTLDNVARFISVLLIFVFVLFITFFSTRYIANFQKSKMSNSNIKIIEVAKITPNKYIEIVKIGDEYFALAIGKDNVEVISKLNEESLNLNAENAQEVTSFKDILEKFKKSANNNANNDAINNEDGKDEDQ